MTKILIIDDVRCNHLLEQHLGSRGFVFDQVLRAADAVTRIETFKPDLVLLDLHFPNDAVAANRTSGGRLHTTLRERFPDLPVAIFSTRPADVAIPAEDFDLRPLAILAKPDFNEPGWDEDFLGRLTRVLVIHHRTAEELSRDLGFIVGRTPFMLEFARRLETAARAGDNLLLRGEAGTGKTLAAEAVHRLSGRSGPFITIRPAALPPGQIAADLAQSFAEADGGTLYLMADDLPNEARMVLLGLLDGQPSDVRIITAIGSHPTASDALRSDLVDRLRRLELTLPPLRERLDDIPELFARAVEAFNAQAPIPVRTALRPETLSKLNIYDWPGNIRELEAVLCQAVTFTRNDVLMPEDIDFDLPLPAPLTTQPAGAAATPQAPDLAGAAIAQLEGIPQGQARYDEYKALPRFLLADVTRRIVAQLATKMKPGQRIKQSELAFYFFGPNDGANHIDAVRRFVSTNGYWGP